MSVEHFRTLALPWPIDLRLTLGPMRRGRYDPTMRLSDRDVLRATLTPEGPATVHLRLEVAAGAVEARAWGSGARWILDTLPFHIGACDDSSYLAAMLSDAAPGSIAGRIKDLFRRHPGLHIPRTGTITETLVPVILEQKVSGLEAHRGYRALVQSLGEPAPGPRALIGDLMLPPPPSVLASTPYWRFHNFGIERKRADTVRLVCSYAPRLESLAALPPSQARKQMTALTGVGAWSAAEVALIALGDADAVSVGDFHLPHQLAWTLTGTPRSDDAAMLELLAPYSGQRGRVVRLVEAAGSNAPRRGPRHPLRSLRDS